MMALVGHGVIIFSIFSGHPPAHPQPFPHNVKCSLLRGSLVCAPCGWSRLSSLRQVDKDAADAAAHHLICHTAAHDQSRANCAAPREAALIASSPTGICYSSDRLLGCVHLHLPDDFWICCVASALEDELALLYLLGLGEKKDS